MAAFGNRGSNHELAISILENADTMGERIGRIGQIETDFSDPNARISSKKIKKNPFRSARSAQSVLPLYLHFPNEKLMFIIHHSSFIIHHYFGTLFGFNKS
jgi:hypothetical protein